MHLGFWGLAAAMGPCLLGDPPHELELPYPYHLHCLALRAALPGPHSPIPLQAQAAQARWLVSCLCCGRGTAGHQVQCQSVPCQVGVGHGL